MEFRDYYQILGIDRKASDKEVRSAFRRLARKYHPDVNPGNKEAEQRFKAVNEAYEVISDREKRRRYDELGGRWKEYETWQRAQQAGGTRGQPFDWARFGFGEPPGGGRRTSRTLTQEEVGRLFDGESPFSEFFETFFGGMSGRGRRAQRQRAGSDVEHPLEVSLAEAYRGTSRRLEQQFPSGQARRLEVRIPPGVSDGSRIRIARQGAEGAGGGPAGDLYLVVSVQPDPRFERRGEDLHTKVSVPLTVCMLGGEIKVPTPDDRHLALRIPPGTRDGQVFRLRGQGMPRLEDASQRGDLLAEAHVQLPTHLTPRQRELFAELASLEATSAASVGGG